LISSHLIFFVHFFRLCNSPQLQFYFATCCGMQLQIGSVQGCHPIRLPPSSHPIRLRPPTGYPGRCRSTMKISQQFVAPIPTSGEVSTVLHLLPRVEVVGKMPNQAGRVSHCFFLLLFIIGLPLVFFVQLITARGSHLFDPPDPFCCSPP
jgi:hypothetical protein